MIKELAIDPEIGQIVAYDDMKIVVFRLMGNSILVSYRVFLANDADSDKYDSIHEIAKEQGFNICEILCNNNDKLLRLEKMVNEAKRKLYESK